MYSTPRGAPVNPETMSNLLQRKYAIFSILTAMYVVAYFYRVSAAVIAGDLAKDLSLTPAQLGNISASLFYAFAITQLPLGPILDRFGSRKTIFLLGLLTTAGSLLFASANGYGHAVAGRVLIGVGTASVLMGSFKAYTAWFSPRQFATLAGLQVAIGNGGNLLATAPLAWMVDSVGWRNTFLLFAILTLLMSMAIFGVVRDTPGEKKPAREGASRAVFKKPAFWILSLLAFFWYGSYMSVQGLWGGPYLMEVLGLDRTGAGWFLLLVAVGFIVGCPLAGYLSDRVIHSRKIVLLGGQGGLLLLLSLFMGPFERLPAALCPFLFFAFGLCVSTGPLLYAQVKELFPPESAASAMTGLNFFVVLGAALIQQIMGTILEGGAPLSAEAFHRAFALPFSGLLIALILYLFCPNTRPE